MRRTARHLLLGVVACALWAQAEAGETLEQAIERLAKAEATCKDAAVKMTLTLRLSHAQLTVTGKGTIDYQIARSNGKRLMRTVVNAVQELKPRQAPGAEPEPALKFETSYLMILDGRFLWMEVRDAKLPQIVVAKMDMAKGPPPGVLHDAMVGLALGDLSRGSLQESLKTLGDKATLKLLAPATVAKHKTTRIEATLKPKAVQAAPQQIRAYIPTRSVTDFDDATATPLARRAYTVDGQEVLSAVATSVQVNSGLDPALFAYEPPPGSLVRDMTQAARAPEPAPAPAPQE